MNVLEQHQQRLPSRQVLELVKQCLERLLALALRGEVKLWAGPRQRQQFGQECHVLFAARARLKQRPQLDKLGFDRVAAAKTGDAFELTNDWEKRAVEMLRRAEIADAGVRLVSKVF